MPTNYYLQVGDSSTSGALDLVDGLNYLLVSGGWHFTAALDPDPLAPVAKGASKSRLATIVLDLEVYGGAGGTGGTGDVLAANLRALETKLWQARLAQGQAPIGTGVCLWQRELGQTQYVFWDVQDGELSIVGADGAGNVKHVTLTLYVLPFAHGAPVTYTITGTLLNGLASVLYQAGIPGDVPALAHLVLGDVSTGGVVIQGFRAGGRSLPTGSLGATDFTPVIDITPASPGATHADAGAIGGATARVTVSTAWQTVGQITRPAGAAQNGLMDVWGTVMDASVVLGQPGLPTVTPSGTGGALTNDVFAYVVVPYDAGHNQGLPTGQVLTTVPVTAADFFDGFESGDTTLWDGYTRAMVYAGLAATSLADTAAAHTMSTGSASLYGLHSKAGTGSTAAAFVNRRAVSKSFVYKAIPGGGTSVSVRMRVKINQLVFTLGDDGVFNRIPLILDTNQNELVWLEAGDTGNYGFRLVATNSAALAAPAAFTAASVVTVAATGLAAATYNYKYLFQNMSGGIFSGGIGGAGGQLAQTPLSAISSAQVVSGANKGVSLTMPSMGQDGSFVIFRTTATTYNQIGTTTFVATDQGTFGSPTVTFIDDGSVALGAAWAAPAYAAVGIPMVDLAVGDWMYLELDVTPSSATIYVDDVQRGAVTLSPTITPAYVGVGTICLNYGQYSNPTPIAIEVFYDDVQISHTAFPIGANKGSAVVAWTAPATGATPAGYYVYVQRQTAGGGTWRRIDAGNVLTYTHTSLTAGTAGIAPPSTLPVGVPTSLKARVAVTTVSATPTWYDGPVVQTQLAGGAREPVCFGTLPLPPVGPQDAVAPPSWTLQFQAITTGTATPTLDLDGCWFLPHLSLPQCSVQVPGLNLATARTWVLDTNRAGFASCQLLAAGTSNVEGSAIPVGALFVGPGDTLLTVLPIVAGGAVDTLNCKFTMQLTVTPRFRSVQGVGQVRLTVSGNEITDITRWRAVTGDGLAYPQTTVGIWAASTNLCSNGGAETNTTGITEAGSTTTRVTTQAKFGAACFNVVTANAAANEGPYESFTATVAVYTVAAWVRGAAGGTVRITVRDNAGANPQSSSAVTLTTAWQRITLTTTTLTAATWRAYVETTVQQALTFQVDGLQAELSPIATPYVETNGSTTTRPAARVQAPATLLSPTQGWWAKTFQPGFASSDRPGARTLFSLYKDASNYVRVVWDGFSIFITEVVDNGTFTQASSAAQSFAAGATLTVIGSWNATSVSISVGGAAFVTTSGRPTPFTAPVTLDIGSWNNTQHQDGTDYWDLGGTGVLTNTDAATLNTQGTAKPAASLLPAAAVQTFSWWCRNEIYQELV